MNLADLGFTKEDLQQRVVEHIAAQVMEGTFTDPDGDEVVSDSNFARTLKELVKQRIDASINGLAEKHILPNVAAYIENLTLQETTKWGEKVGKPVTFIEYLTQRAEAYMQEKVDYQGKTKGEAGGFSWNGTQTRITHLIHQHLHYSIDSAMKAALKDATGHIAKGIADTAKVKLAEVAEKMRIEVKV